VVLAGVTSVMVAPTAATVALLLVTVCVYVMLERTLMGLGVAESEMERSGVWTVTGARVVGEIGVRSGGTDGDGLRDDGAVCGCPADLNDEGERGGAAVAHVVCAGARASACGTDGRINAVPGSCADRARHGNKCCVGGSALGDRGRCGGIRTVVNDDLGVGNLSARSDGCWRRSVRRDSQVSRLSGRRGHVPKKTARHEKGEECEGGGEFLQTKLRREADAATEYSGKLQSRGEQTGSWQLPPFALDDQDATEESLSFGIVLARGVSASHEGVRRVAGNQPVDPKAAGISRQDYISAARLAGFDRCDDDGVAVAERGLHTEAANLEANPMA